MKEITNRWTGKVMFPGMTLEMVLESHKKWLRGESDGLRANLRGTNLSYADLRGTNLRSTDLSYADLSYADLRGTDLRRTDLSDADLRGTNLSDADLRYAELRGTNLSDADLRDADLRGTDLRGTNLSDADLSYADLRGTNLSDAPFKIENIHQKVYEAASKEYALDMYSWHKTDYCGTTHCRAGWVVVLAGEAGKTLEWAYGTFAAAAMIYIASDPKIGKMPNFYCDNETALADMKERAEKEAKDKRG